MKNYFNQTYGSNGNATSPNIHTTSPYSTGKNQYSRTYSFSFLPFIKTFSTFSFLLLFQAPIISFTAASISLLTLNSIGFIAYTDENTLLTKNSSFI